MAFFYSECSLLRASIHTVLCSTWLSKYHAYSFHQHAAWRSQGNLTTNLIKRQHALPREPQSQGLKKTKQKKGQKNKKNKPRQKESD